LRSNGSIQANVDKMESPPASCFIHHPPPAEARYQASPGSLGYKIIDESGFGGWADEKIESVREAAPNVESKKIHPQHLTISRLLQKTGPVFMRG
jgi:hypothetical protein